MSIQISDPKVQAVIDELREQRDVALDSVALLKGELAESNAAISALSTKIGELQKRLDSPESTTP